MQKLMELLSSKRNQITNLSFLLFHLKHKNKIFDIKKPIRKNGLFVLFVLFYSTLAFSKVLL
ncbi:hypothetical protein D3C72_939130 [compost metagenome]